MFTCWLDIGHKVQSTALKKAFVWTRCFVPLDISGPPPLSGWGGGHFLQGGGVFFARALGGGQCPPQGGKCEPCQNQTMFVNNNLFFLKSHHNTLSKKKFCFVTRSHWQAGALQSLCIRHDVENSNLWGLLFTLSSSQFSIKKLFFLQIYYLKRFVKKSYRLLFFFALTFFTIMIVEKKLKFSKFLPKIKFVFTTTTTLKMFLNTCYLFMSYAKEMAPIRTTKRACI